MHVEHARTPEQVAPREHLYKGSNLRVTETTYLPPGKEVGVPFEFDQTANPLFNRRPFDPEKDTAGIHERTRTAHLNYDPTDEAVKLATYILTEFPPQIGKQRIILPMINRGSRDGVLVEGDEPMHAYVVPESAWIEGQEFMDIIGNHPEVGINIILDKQLIDGKSISAFYARAEDKRFWLPPGDIVLVGHMHSFEQVRKYLFARRLKHIDDPEFPMPEGHMYIASMPRINLPQDKYILIERDVYNREGNGFVKVGTHLHSPLLESRTNDHGHNLELAKGEWVRCRLIQNGDELKAG